MIEGILLGFGVILVALGYGFKLDFMKFMAGVIFVMAGIYMAYNLTWFGGQQWVFIIIGAFGLALPLWIHTIWGMTQESKKRKLAIVTAKSSQPYVPEGEEEDEEDIEIERERKYYEKKWKPAQTKRSKRNNTPLF